MEIEDRQNISWCKAACGNNVYEHCFEQSAKAKAIATCPLPLKLVYWYCWTWGYYRHLCQHSRQSRREWILQCRRPISIHLRESLEQRLAGLETVVVSVTNVFKPNDIDRFEPVLGEHALKTE